MRALDLDVIEQWRQSDTKASIHFSADPDTLLDWLLGKQWTDTNSLCEALWRQMTLPDKVANQLTRLQV